MATDSKAMHTPGSLPVGLREPWEWFQPMNREELKARLIEARDLNVHERERENLCSCAHTEIEKLEFALESVISALRGVNGDWTEALTEAVDVAHAAIGKPGQKEPT